MCTKGVARVGLFDAIHASIYYRVTTFTKVTELRNSPIHDEKSTTLRKVNFSVNIETMYLLTRFLRSRFSLGSTCHAASSNFARHGSRFAWYPRTTDCMESEAACIRLSIYIFRICKYVDLEITRKSGSIIDPG